MSPDCRPVGTAEFAAIMDRLGPFEPGPRVAAGVSGGRDSLALCLLLGDWVRSRGGSLLALTVDHGLRQNAADEAVQVGTWLAARGIAHEILTWTGPKPGSGIQAAARAARYRLLGERCRAEGILHLALAHQLEDQAETVLLRFAKGSGVDGLAAMAAVRETADVRLVRPLLGLSRTRLTATLEAAGQPWIDDPSNRSEIYARVRLRGAAHILTAEGLTAARLTDTARRAGRVRAALEEATAALLARTADIWPEGCILLNAAGLAGASEELALRGLGHCLRAVGGEHHPPRLEAVERLHCRLRDGTLGAGRTLAGCRIMPWRGRILIAREAGVANERRDLAAGETILWDGRFQVRRPAGADQRACTVARLGEDGWARLCRARPEQRNSALARLPAVVRAGLPALWRDGVVPELPHMGYTEGNGLKIDSDTEHGVSALFVPRAPVCGPSFAVV